MFAPAPSPPPPHPQTVLNFCSTSRWTTVLVSESHTRIVPQGRHEFAMTCRFACMLFQQRTDFEPIMAADAARHLHRTSNLLMFPPTATGRGLPGRGLPGPRLGPPACAPTLSCAPRLGDRWRITDIPGSLMGKRKEKPLAGPRTHQYQQRSKMFDVQTTSGTS
jgi:hypothetical protein